MIVFIIEVILISAHVFCSARSSEMKSDESAVRRGYSSAVRDQNKNANQPASSRPWKLFFDYEEIFFWKKLKFVAWRVQALTFFSNPADKKCHKFETDSIAVPILNVYSQLTRTSAYQRWANDLTPRQSLVCICISVWLGLDEPWTALLNWVSIERKWF